MTHDTERKRNEHRTEKIPPRLGIEPAPVPAPSGHACSRTELE